MKELSIVNREESLVIDSREVAEMVGKNHKDLMRDIRGYVAVLENSNERNFAPVDFFMESTYQDGKGETRPCFLLTRKGCDMVANKLTGEKGIRFTAAYIERFHEMEKSQSNPLPQLLSPAQTLRLQLEMMESIERRQDEQAERLDKHEKVLNDVTNVLTAAAPVKDDWQTIMNERVRGMCLEYGLGFHNLFAQLYTQLEAQTRCDLKARVTRKRTRMAKAGLKKTDQNRVTKLSVIAEDPKLRIAFVKLVQDAAVKNAFQQGSHRKDA